MLKRKCFSFLFCFTLLIGASFLFAPHADAKSLCGTSGKISSSFSLNEGLVTVVLGYDTCTQSNFALVSIAAYNNETLIGQALVDRQSGPDGGIAQAWGYQCSASNAQSNLCPSTELYSPHNKARACWEDYDYDYWFCTAYF